MQVSSGVFLVKLSSIEWGLIGIEHFFMAAYSKNYSKHHDEEQGYAHWIHSCCHSGSDMVGCRE
jgi:hypothetical protein